ncbi:SDR family NAD(P)-dependent oxidoreductase [Mycobacterium conspicuum]|uniref:3-ketoacyl-ACP reductase n=1 Tax=Mycobacterium conspicuum TaxID=44010 RepID=A0A1X1T0L8_9MYCO|nr:SDR family oxidoreductase [Mycobacterium conspicuum]ORV37740.1 3-ketoacyl-ACP reductase [Mycobacterium conspicuum]BBZ41487.1 3-ketoacyl-ACP reductase [Mycobacterium conspicuum]
MSTGFEGRVSLITGAGSGIGKGMAIAFATAGARVVAADINPASAEQTAIEIGKAASPLGVDISDASSVNALVQHVVGTFGRIDVLCNNAGVLDTMALPADTTIDEWERVLRINLTGTFLVTRAVLPHMLQNGAGAIVNTASEAGIRGGAAGAPYTASKHGVVGLTRSVAWAHANDGIRCNAIVPGPVFSGAAGSVEGFDETGVERLKPIITLNQHVALPEQIAGVALFLASDAASFINGAIVPVDAGWSAG